MIKNHTQTEQVDWVTLSQNASGQWTPKGPFKTQEVLKMLLHSEIKPTDYCWQSGWGNWKRICDVSQFYHSRKPPIELNTVKKESALDGIFNHQPSFTEMPEKLKPQRRAEVGPKKGSIKMLEPWENRNKDQSIEKGKNKDYEFSKEVPSELSSDSLEKHFASDSESAPALQPGVLSLRRWRTWFLLSFCLVIALLFDLTYNGKVRQIMEPVVNPTATNLKVSYLSVADYNLKYPKHLIVRTDLQKGAKIIVRLLNMDETPIATIGGGAGLVIPSKGTGRTRIPLYPYSLQPGSYKAFVKAEGVEVLKTFHIPRATAWARPASASATSTAPARAACSSSSMATPMKQ